MRALAFDRELTFVADYPEPSAIAGESVVEVTLAGICGTDLEITRGYMAYRGVPGHEFVGRVVQSEDAALIGKRVVGEINAACGDCGWCRRVMGRHCAARTVLGIAGRDGAFAELLRIPNLNLLEVPDAVSDEAAVFTEPIAAAYEILEQTGSLDGNCLILGDGRLGAIVAMVLSAEGYRVELSGHHGDKLRRIAALARNGGAIEVAIDEPPKLAQYNVVIDCTGSPSGFARALELVEPRGTIFLKSTAAASVAINLAPVVINEITVIGSRCGRFTPALAALVEHKLDPRPLIDGVFALDDGIAAFTAAADPAKFKILIRAS
jgi:alcohol dehydrogenase